MHIYNFFDITHTNALNMMDIEKSKVFLSAQQEPSHREP